MFWSFATRQEVSYLLELLWLLEPGGRSGRRRQSATGIREASAGTATAVHCMQIQSHTMRTLAFKSLPRRCKHAVPCFPVLTSASR